MNGEVSQSDAPTGFVKISAITPPAATYSRSIAPFCIPPRKKRQGKPKHPVPAWFTGLPANATAPRPSPCITVGPPSGIPTPVSSHRSHIAPRVATLRATYSASVADGASPLVFCSSGSLLPSPTQTCFLEVG